jgi:hypothetical protein
MYSLYKNEYRICKLVETTIKKEEEMIYTWKSHKETPCVAILTNQKFHFFSSFLIQNQRTGG